MTAEAYQAAGITTGAADEEEEKEEQVSSAPVICGHETKKHTPHGDKGSQQRTHEAELGTAAAEKAKKKSVSRFSFFKKSNL